MPGIELLRSFLEHATATGSRSTVLSDLRWFIAIAISGMLLASFEHAAGWIVVMLGAAVAVAVALYLVAYIWFGLKNPDALRSEKFSLTKMAIEQSAKGDNLHGFSTSPAKELIDTEIVTAQHDAILPPVK